MQVDVHRPGEGVGDDQRGRRQVVGADVGVDPALEVAVAAEHGDGDQVVAVDLFGDRRGQGAGVADAGRAAVADQVEPELVEVRVEPGVAEIVGDDLGARGQAGLHPRFRLQPALDGLLRQDAGRDHHRGIRGVGAARDRGDHDRAVGDRRRASATAVVVAPFACSSTTGSSATAAFFLAGRAAWSSLSAAANDVLASRSGTRSCGRRGPARLGSTVERSSSSVSEYAASGAPGLAEHPLGPGVRLDQPDRLRRPAGELEISERLDVDREQAAGRSVLGGHVGDRRPVGERQVRQPVPVVFDELPDHPLLAEHLRDRQHEVGRGRPLAAEFRSA